MLSSKTILEIRGALLAIAMCIFSGCYVEVDKHYQVSPTLENPLEVVLGGKVTDQLLAIWENVDRDSAATLESLRQITSEVPIVADNPLLIDKTPQQLWEQAIEQDKSRSFQAAIRAVSLRPADRSLAIKLVGPQTNRRVGWWTWRLRKFEGIAATTAATECAGHANDPVVLANGLMQRGPDWAGGDLMTVVELSDSERLFIFGDTLQGEVDANGSLQPGFRMVRNSALLQTGSCFTPIRPAGGAGWIPGATATSWLWPQDAFVQDDQLFVFMVEVTNEDNGVPGLNFKSIGGALALFDFANLDEPTQIIRNSPTFQQSPFGTSAVTKGAFHYLYAHGQSPDTSTYVARVRTADVTNFSAWRFWNGRIWQKNAEQSAAISPVKLHVGTEPNGTLLATTLPFGGSVIATSTARRPMGPFVATAESGLDLAEIWPDTPSWAYRPIVLGVDQYRQRTVAVNFLPWNTIEMIGNVHLYGPRFLTDPITMRQ